MSQTESLDERMRLVELNAIRATTESASATDQGLLEANRSAEETIKLITAKYEREGVQIDALSATGQPGAIKIRSEVTMSQVAAEKLFGQSPTSQQKQNQAEMLRLWKFRNRMSHANRKGDTGSELVREFAQGFTKRLLYIALPDWMQAVLKLDREDKSDAALDELFDRIDPMLAAGEFDKVDGILAAMPVEGPSLTLMIGLLSITRPAGDHLPLRPKYFDRVYRLCKAMRRDAELLLGGLR